MTFVDFVVTNPSNPDEFKQYLLSHIYPARPLELDVQTVPDQLSARRQTSPVTKNFKFNLVHVHPHADDFWLQVLFIEPQLDYIDDLITIHVNEDGIVFSVVER